MPPLVWSPRAEEDLIEINVTIGFDNLPAAERLYTAIERRAVSLRAHPRLGMRRPDIAVSARVLVEGVYLILYETHPDTDEGQVDSVEIVRILHGHRDLKLVFEL